METRLNLGCGNHPLPGFVNIDISEHADADEYWDITKHWPYQDNSVDFVKAVDVIEHILDPIPVMNEAWRVLKPAHEIYIETPLAGTNEFYKDPTHVKGWVPETFEYFCNTNVGKLYKIKPWKIRAIELVKKKDRIYCNMRTEK